MGLCFETVARFYHSGLHTLLLALLGSHRSFLRQVRNEASQHHGKSAVPAAIPGLTDFRGVYIARILNASDTYLRPSSWHILHVGGRSEKEAQVLCCITIVLGSS